MNKAVELDRWEATAQSMRCVGRGGPGLPSILTRKLENSVRVTASNAATTNSTLALRMVRGGTSKSMS